VTGTLWPDFSRRDLLRAILEYQKRDRRYGGLSVAQTEDDLAGVRSDAGEALVGALRPS
jgi:undecaprenyl diphosphate synthase